MIKPRWSISIDEYALWSRPPRSIRSDAPLDDGRQEPLQIKWTNNPTSREIPKMSAAPDFAIRRFQSAAAHYSAGRAPYPAALIARTVELLRLDTHDRLMDLG